MKRLLPLLFVASTSFAQTPPPPAPPQAPPPPPPKPQILRTVPPPGIAITSADRAELTAGAAALGRDIAALETELKGKPELLALLPDVLIFHKAVDWALRYDEFFSPGEVAKAKQQLELGNARVADLRAGKPSWNALTGADGKPTADGKDKLPAMTVRGYRSKIDGSVQPYGIILPEDYKPGETKGRPLHFWCHGRGEKLSELDFINGRLTSKGEYTPPGAFVIHLYGRYCCANKFAGEVDLFEALADAKKHYPIDDARLVIRGFSMGGGAAWQFATHFAGLWAATNPGAGFGETKEFMKLGTAPDRPLPPEWEQKLWRWYDSTGYVSNLRNTTTVAYSGEIDGQKQAADIMIRYARQEAGQAEPVPGRVGVPPAGSGVSPERPSGSSQTVTDPQTHSPATSAPQVREGGTSSPAGGTPTLPGTAPSVAPGDGSPKAEESRVQGTTPDLVLYHVIAPQTPHKVVEPAKTEVEKLVAAAVEKGNDPVPKKVHFTTYSLIYPKMEWVTVLGMEKQWERADIEAAITPTGLSVKTKNVTGFMISLPKEGLPADGLWALNVDGQNTKIATGGGYFTQMRKDKTGQWISEHKLDSSDPEKNPKTCGPIDHAFMDSFVFVRPSGKPLNKVVGDWVEGELGRAVTQWRAVFRGDARVIADSALTEDDIKNSNLVLWGDPSSNAILKKIADKLPVKWDAKQLAFGGKTYDATHVAPVLIFPNPLNPQKYVVLNSGFTMREAAAANNAQQTPKLPDWAIIDVNSPADAYQPGRILRAGFFNEQWQPPTQ